MFREPPFWSLGRPLRRPFTFRATMFTYMLIFGGMIFVVLFTLFTKGWQLDCDDRQLLSTEPILHNNTELWKTCKSSTVYPGQTFSNPDSTFIFEALTLGNITHPATLENCQLAQGSSLQVINFPASAPQIKFNMTLMCLAPITSQDDRPIANFAGNMIYPNSVVLGIQGINSSPNNKRSYYADMMNITLDLRNSGSVCGNALLDGFTVYGVPPKVVWMADNHDGTVCEDNGPHWSDLNLRQFGIYNETLSSALADLRMLSPLPNMVFNCPVCTRQLISPLQLLWTIVVALGSTWSVILLVTTSIVGGVHHAFDPTYDFWLQTAQYESQSKPNTPGFAAFPSEKVDVTFPPRDDGSPESQTLLLDEERSHRRLSSASASLKTSPTPP